MTPSELPFEGTRPIALVTGGAVRVGRAICLQLARRGMDVMLTFRSSAAEAEGVAGEIRSLGAASATAPLDLSDPEDVVAFGETLVRSLPRLDVLVHNASVYEPSPLDQIDHRGSARQYTVNAESPLVLSAALAPLLSRSAGSSASIVAMLDIHAEAIPRRGYATYAMSKAALGAMVRSLARDLAPNVRVNGVTPGVVAWPDTGPDADTEAQKRYISRVPMGRSGTPEEAARAVAFLALDATYTTGQTLHVDGGRSLG